MHRGTDTHVNDRCEKYDTMTDSIWLALIEDDSRLPPSIALQCGSFQLKSGQHIQQQVHTHKPDLSDDESNTKFIE